MTDAGPAEPGRAPAGLHALGGCGVGLLLVALLIWASGGGDGLAWGFAAVGLGAVLVWVVGVSAVSVAAARRGTSG